MKVYAEIDERELARHIMFSQDDNDSCLKAFAMAFAQANSRQQAMFMREIVKHLDVTCGGKFGADKQAIYMKDDLDERTLEWLGMMQ